MLQNLNTKLHLPQRMELVQIIKLLVRFLREGVTRVRGMTLFGGISGLLRRGRNGLGRGRKGGK